MIGMMDVDTKMKLDLPELGEGEELYCWDDIRFLSGSAGLAVVKDGLVQKTCMVAIS